MIRVIILISCFTYVLTDQMNYRVVTVERKSDVNRDIQEFINLLPTDKIKSIVQEYVANDTEVKKFREFIHSRPVQEVITKIVRSPEYQNVFHHLTSSGLDVNNFMLQIHHLLGGASPSAPVKRAGTGLRGLLLGDIKPLIPMPKLKLLATQKYIFSSEFRGLVRIITSKEFKNDVHALLTSVDVRHLEDSAKFSSIDLNAIYEFIASFQFLYEYLMDL